MCRACIVIVVRWISLDGKGDWLVLDGWLTWLVWIVEQVNVLGKICTYLRCALCGCFYEWMLCPCWPLHLICFGLEWFTVNTLFLFLQCTCKGLVKVVTKANMTAQHKLVEYLVSEVTFGKVEHILQVNSLPGDRLKAILPPRNFHVYQVLTHFALHNNANKKFAV